MDTKPALAYVAGAVLVAGSVVAVGATSSDGGSNQAQDGASPAEVLVLTPEEVAETTGAGANGSSYDEPYQEYEDDDSQSHGEYEDDEYEHEDDDSQSHDEYEEQDDD